MNLYLVFPLAVVRLPLKASKHNSNKIELLPPPPGMFWHLNHFSSAWLCKTALGIHWMWGRSCLKTGSSKLLKGMLYQRAWSLMQGTAAAQDSGKWGMLGRAHVMTAVIWPLNQPEWNLNIIGSLKVGSTPPSSQNCNPIRSYLRLDCLSLALLLRNKIHH